MIEVIVERGLGDKQGPDVSDELITDTIVAVERGRIECDKTSSNRNTVNITGPYTGFIRPGKLVRVMDSQQQEWVGKVISSNISISFSDNGLVVATNLVVERED